MTATCRLSPDQIDELLALREKGLSFARIGARMGMSAGGVAYLCLSRGATSPREGRWRNPNAPRVMRGRDGRILRRFSADEDARLAQLSGEGLTLTEIARRLGRPRTSVRMRMLMLGAAEDRAGR